MAVFPWVRDVPLTAGREWQSWSEMLRLGFAVLLAGVVACSSDPDDEFGTECEPSIVRACVCEDGSTATQTCDPESAKWGACACAPAEEACQDDDDCSDRDFPACVEDVCVEPVWVDGGGDCSDPATRCRTGFVCENSICLVTGED